MGIILLIVIGAIAGFIARALVPGKDSMGILPTIVLGIVGSFIGGFLGALIFGRDAIAETIARDTGSHAAEAQLLSIGLTGLMEVSARWWLTSPDRIPRDRAVELLMGLAWRGISGTPRTD